MKEYFMGDNGVRYKIENKPDDPENYIIHGEGAYIREFLCDDPERVIDHAKDTILKNDPNKKIDYRLKKIFQGPNKIKNPQNNTL